ncbi:hypothetical protein [Bartonella quintana]|nr:hypothetical protein [Bartonella quintana]
MTVMFLLQLLTGIVLAIH